MTESEMTDFQKWMLMMCRRGSGISRKRSDMSGKQMRESDAMVAAGILKRSKNYPGDKSGMYIIDKDPGWDVTGASLS